MTIEMNNRTREGKPRELPSPDDKKVALVLKTSSKADESSTTASETTSGISKPWLTGKLLMPVLVLCKVAVLNRVLRVSASLQQEFPASASL